MSAIPTPRTDEAEAKSFKGLCNISLAFDFARQLERDLAALQEKLNRYEGKLCLICGAKAPCELDKSEMSPCTFDPNPIDAAKRFQRDNDHLREKLSALWAKIALETILIL